MKNSWKDDETVVPIPRHSENYKVNKMIDYILHNWNYIIELEEIASHIGATPQYASTLFSRTMCMTMVQYINALRVNNAAHLLTTTELSVSDVSAECGFQDTSYFIKTFHTLSGETPGEYRRRRSVDGIYVDGIDEA